MKVHFGSGNDSAEDYYIDIGNCTVRSLFPKNVKYIKVETHKYSVKNEVPDNNYFVDWSQGGSIDSNGNYVFSVNNKIARTWATGIDSYVLPSGLKNVKIKLDSDKVVYHKPHVNLVNLQAKCKLAPSTRGKAEKDERTAG